MANSLKDYMGTIFFTSHDRTFTSLLADTIIEIKDKKISLYSGDYDSYVYKTRLEALKEEEEEIKFKNNNNNNNNNRIIKMTTGPNAKKLGS